MSDLAGGGTVVPSAESAIFALGRGRNGGSKCRIGHFCTWAIGEGAVGLDTWQQSLHEFRRKTGDFADITYSTGESC